MASPQYQLCEAETKFRANRKILQEIPAEQKFLFKDSKLRFEFLFKDCFVNRVDKTIPCYGSRGVEAKLRFDSFQNFRTRASKDCKPSLIFWERAIGEDQMSSPFEKTFSLLQLFSVDRKLNFIHWKNNLRYKFIFKNSKLK